jgi:hypothetical protein
MGSSGIAACCYAAYRDRGLQTVGFDHWLQNGFSEAGTVYVSCQVHQLQEIDRRSRSVHDLLGKVTWDKLGTEVVPSRLSSPVIWASCGVSCEVLKTRSLSGSAFGLGKLTVNQCSETSMRGSATPYSRHRLRMRLMPEPMCTPLHNRSHSPAVIRKPSSFNERSKSMSLPADGKRRQPIFPRRSVRPCVS